MGESGTKVKLIGDDGGVVTSRTRGRGFKVFFSLSLFLVALLLALFCFFFFFFVVMYVLKMYGEDEMVACVVCDVG